MADIQLIQNVDLEGIKAVLPHREPFLLLSRIVECRVGEYCKAEWTLTGEEDFFKGHFPGMPVLPGVLQLESIAQAGAFAVLSKEAFKGKIALFGAADKVKFRRQVLPGDTLTLEIEMTKIGSMAGKGKGKSSVDGQSCCEAELTFVFAKNQPNLGGE